MADIDVYSVRKTRNVGKDKDRKDKGKDKTKRRIKKQKQSHDKKKFKRTLKDKYEEEIVDLPNIHKVEDKLYHVVERNGSYSPEINRHFAKPLGKIDEHDFEINFEDYYNNGEPLTLYNPNGIDYDERFKPYDSIESRIFLLDRLDLKIDIGKIIPPKQNDSNCWFNCMFMALFVSDKGRKFFKFFRHLMIEGTQSSGIEIPTDLKIAFAYLNYAIDACLTGNSIMHDLDTNNIIRRIYESFPILDNNDWIIAVGQYGNPIYYYMNIMDYLNNHSVDFLLLNDILDCKWKDKLYEEFVENDKIPEIIVIELFDDNQCINKPVTFKINDIKYALDCMCIRDVGKNHVCTLLTCNSKEYFYDGDNDNTFIPFEWKKKINTDSSWKSIGLEYNLLKSYQQLIYYRVTK